MTTRGRKLNITYINTPRGSFSFRKSDIHRLFRKIQFKRALRVKSISGIESEQVDLDSKSLKKWNIEYNTIK